MTKTEYKKMKDRVERFGSYKIFDSPNSYTEVIKYDKNDYALYSVYRHPTGVVETNCFGVGYNFDQLCDFMID